MPEASSIPLTDYASALERLRHPLFIGGEKHQEQSWRADRRGADPDILEFERRFIRRMNGLSVPFFAHSVVRTEEQQLELYRKGVSNNSGTSPYPHSGYAVDLVHSVRAWDLERKEWDLIGHIGKEVAASAGIKVTWGGDFTSLYDPAHWELTNWYERSICLHFHREAGKRCPSCRRRDAKT